MYIIATSITTSQKTNCVIVPHCYGPLVISELLELLFISACLHSMNSPLILSALDERA